jgi:hypothetical protein
MILGILMDVTGLGQNDILKIVWTAPIRYKVFNIPKRRGGQREIAQPAREVKALQRALVDTFLARLPVHDAAKAYRTGVSLLQNARAHLNSSYILKLDFESFFNSIRVADWEAYLRRSNLGLTAEDRFVLQRLLFYGNGTTQPAFLSVGAPSSPMVSNVVMFDFDTNLQRYADQLELNYTRYADDISVSGRSKRSILQFEARTIRLLDSMSSPKLRLNKEKRGFYSRAGKRMVTGLVITPDNAVSLGRERKRLISSMVHHIVVGSDRSELHTMRTKGYLGFAVDIEPEFLERLRLKYGNAIIDSILSFQPAPPWE